jgi:glycosyltransferase involved in cell wall biosynthesis
MRNQKLISICIPTYNREKDLEEALKSVLRQIGPDVEVVVSDNCSADGTREMVERYQQEHPTLRYSVNESNLGFDRNMHRCVKLAEGEYVWFFGSDDLLKPGGVDAVRQALQDRPAMVYLNHEVFNESSGKVLVKNMLRWTKDRTFRSANAYIALIGSDVYFMTALILRRDLCLQVEDVEATYGTGWVHLHMVLWILAHGNSFRYIGFPYVRARYRRVADWDALPVFARANKTIWNAHKYGHAYWVLYLLISRTLLDVLIRVVVADRVKGRRSAKELLSLLVRAYWMFPHFWLLVFPLVCLPRGFLWGVRQTYRYLRAVVEGTEKDLARP